MPRLRPVLRIVPSVATSFAASVVLLAGCAAGPGPLPGPPPGVDDIAAVDFRQSQALPEFDDSEYTQDDPDAIAEFRALLREHDVDPATWAAPDSGCPGSRTTQVTVRYRDSDLATQLSVDTCSDDPFELAADELFASWREALAR